MARAKRIRTILLIAALIVMSLIAVFSTAAAQTEGTIAGIVFVDTNGNGIREEGEEGLQDVEVTFDSGGWSTTINTTDTGAFELDVNPATWTVSVAPPAGYTVDVSSTEVLIENPGDEITNVEFALVAQTEDDEAGDGTEEILPASGSVISSGAVIGGLIGLMVIGLALVLVGQRRNKLS